MNKEDKKFYFWLILSVLIISSVLFFQYPLMKIYQSNDSSIPGDSKFALTTARGDSYQAYDINLYSRTTEVLSQNPGLFVKDTMAYEHRSEIIPLQGSFPFLLHSLFQSIISNPSYVILLGLLISTAILVIILFSYGKILQKKYLGKYSNLQSFLFASVVIVFPSILYFALDQIRNPNQLTRIYLGYAQRFIYVNYISIFFFFCLLLVSYIVINKPKSVKPFILVGLTLAIIQYCYFYYYTSALLFTFLLLVLNFGINLTTIKNLFVTYGTWFVLSLPYLINIVMYRSETSDFALKAGAASSSFENWSLVIKIVVVVAILILIDYFYLKKTQKKFKILEFIKESSFSTSFIITLLVLLNLNKIIGYSVQPDHWIFVFAHPTIVILLFIAFFKMQKIISFEKTIKVLVISALVVSLVLASWHGLVAAKQLYPYTYFDNSDKEMIKFIKSSTPEDSVFFADTSYANSIISTNTGRWTLVDHPLYSKANLAEINKRVVFGYKSLGFSEQKLLADINTSRGYVPVYLGSLSSLKWNDSYQNWNNFNHYYQSYYQTEGDFDYSKLSEDIDYIYQTSSKSFKLDYAVYTKGNAPQNAMGKKVFGNERYAIFKLTSN